MASWLPQPRHDAMTLYSHSQVASAGAAQPSGAPQSANGGAQTQNQTNAEFEQDCLIVGASVLGTTLIGTGLYLGFRKQAPTQISIMTSPDIYPFLTLEHRGQVGGFPKYSQPADQGVCGFATIMTLLEGQPMKNGKPLHSGLMDTYHRVIAEREYLKRAQSGRMGLQDYTERLSSREFCIAYMHMLGRLKGSDSNEKIRQCDIPPAEQKFEGHVHGTVRGGGDGEVTIAENMKDRFHVQDASDHPDEKNKDPGSTVKPLPTAVDRFAVLHAKIADGQTDDAVGHWVSIVMHRDGRWHCHDSANATATVITDQTGAELPKTAHPADALKAILPVLCKQRGVSGYSSLEYQVVIPNGFRRFI